MKVLMTKVNLIWIGSLMRTTEKRFSVMKRPNNSVHNAKKPFGIIERLSLEIFEGARIITLKTAWLQALSKESL